MSKYIIKQYKENIETCIDYYTTIYDLINREITDILNNNSVKCYVKMDLICNFFRELNNDEKLTKALQSNLFDFIDNSIKYLNYLKFIPEIEYYIVSMENLRDTINYEKENGMACDFSNNRQGKRKMEECEQILKTDIYPLNRDFPLEKHNISNIINYYNLNVLNNELKSIIKDQEYFKDLNGQGIRSKIKKYDNIIKNIKDFKSQSQNIYKEHFSEKIVQLYDSILIDSIETIPYTYDLFIKLIQK